ncbi:alpha-xylosidase, partial [bacterium]
MRRGFVVLILITFVINVGLGYAFIHQADGVVLELKKIKSTDANRLRIQVCAEDIIRVTATRQCFSKRPSLIVDKTEWDPVAWTLDEEGEILVLKTAKLSIKVHQENGTVAFYDANGHLLLQEKAKGSKIITPTAVMGEQTYHIQQLFESPKDEAFFGLGQHQNNIMNYKGHDVDLWQYNVVAAVPFLVSSKNYGILWDNNSRSKFGDIRDFESLSTLKLIDKDGKEGGLTAEYFKDANFTSLFTTQQES